MCLILSSLKPPLSFVRLQSLRAIFCRHRFGKETRILISFQAHPVGGCFETVLGSDKNFDRAETQDGELVVSNLFALFLVVGGGEHGVAPLQGHEPDKQGMGFNAIFRGHTEFDPKMQLTLLVDISKISMFSMLNPVGPDRGREHHQGVLRLRLGRGRRGGPRMPPLGSQDTEPTGINIINYVTYSILTI